MDSGTGGISESLGSSGQPATTSSSGTTAASESTSSTATADVTSESMSDPSTTTGTTQGGEESSSSGSEGCNGSEECEDGLCFDGICVPTFDPCTDDADCNGDTYCCDADCLPDDADEPVCVPYGEPLDTQNEECTQEVVIGLFEPNVQCEWIGPGAMEPFPDHANVLTTPLVAQLPTPSGFAGEILVVSYNCDDGGSPASMGTDPGCFGIIRILDGQSCTLLESIDDPMNRVIAAPTPSIADLDADGTPEIVAHRANGGIIAFRWDGMQYQTWWVSTTTDIVGFHRWDAVAVHDLDDDGFPEIVSGSEVYDGMTGARLNPGQVVAGSTNSPGVVSVLGDLDVDGEVELIASDVYRWDTAMNRWELAYDGPAAGKNFAFADFGTPGMTAAQFDPLTLDGVAEVVAAGVNTVSLWTLDGQMIMTAPINNGGPPTVGDFDDDGFPEIAAAGGTEYVVYDLDCAAAGPGCAGAYIRWTQPSQDSSSAQTGSSIFDFEGDGPAEAVYADECFTRVYEGATGDVLYSAARTSCTWYENPIVADPDFDEKSEIIVGSNTNCSISCPLIDPIHPGVRCEENADCPSGTCDNGLCRCGDDTECSEGQQCVAPLPGTPGMGDVCRAAHPPDIALTGVRVLRDQLDRWASSRELWNQHAYSVTNVDDDLSVDSTSTWQQNFLDPELNNYRQNRQGNSSAEDLPDITGQFDEFGCFVEGDTFSLTGTVCNRGLSTVAALLPATFYLGDPADGNVLCTAFTDQPVPVEGCREVSCQIPAAVTGEITMVVNDDGVGGALTVECIDTNNTDVIDVERCVEPG